MTSTELAANLDFTPELESSPTSGVVVRRGDIAHALPALPPVRPRMTTLLGLGDGDFDTRATLPFVRSEDAFDPPSPTPSSWACSIDASTPGETTPSSRAPQVALHDDVDPDVVDDVRRSAERLLALRAFEPRRSVFDHFKNWLYGAFSLMRRALAALGARPAHGAR